MSSVFQLEGLEPVGSETWTVVPISDVGDMIDAAWLNTYLKQDFRFVGVHTHSGAAGQGSATPGPLTYLDDTDFYAAQPAPATGRTRVYVNTARWHYRPNGGSETKIAKSTHATEHDAAGADVMAIDAAAATGSLRTLGTGALQAAAGNHTHGG